MTLNDVTACRTFRPLIGAREGELDRDQAGELAAHLSGCDGCRAFATRLAVTEGLVSEALMAAAAQRDFAPFVDGVMARIEASRPRPLLSRLTGWLRLHPRAVLGGALAPLVAALAVGAWLQLGPGHEVASVSPLEVTAEGGATTIIQSSDGPVVLLDDDDDPT